MNKGSLNVMKSNEEFWLLNAYMLKCKECMIYLDYIIMTCFIVMSYCIWMCLVYDDFKRAFILQKYDLELS